MDSRQLTTSLSSTRNSSKQATPSSLNMTWSFIGIKRVLDISCPPTQPFGGSSNPPPACHWCAHPCLLPPCPITSVRCWRSPHPPNCRFVTTKYHSSHFQPINTSHFHLGPKRVLRAPHTSLYQAHAASSRRCSHICPWATHCAKAHNNLTAKGGWCWHDATCAGPRPPMKHSSM